MELSIICALAANRAIGLRGELLYYLPADLRHFKQLTTGHTIVMGRKTFESLPKGALPNRRNIVITRQADYERQGIEVFHSFEEALEACSNDGEVYIIGGESIYRQMVDECDVAHITKVDFAYDADAHFPNLDGKPEWHSHCTQCMSCYHHCPKNAIQFRKLTLGKGQYYFGKSLHEDKD